MFEWQLQVVPMAAVVGKPVGIVIPPGWPVAVGGGKPWQEPQAAAVRVAGRVLVQVGVRAVPVVSPPGMAAPWQ